MRQIQRNGPCLADDIEVRAADDGRVVILNRRTHAYASSPFLPTPENIESVMQQCFEAGQRAKAAEVRAALSIGDCV